MAMLVPCFSTPGSGGDDISGLLALDAQTDFDAAALIYRRCRTAGIPPRGMIDSAITATAWRTGA